MDGIFQTMSHFSWSFRVVQNLEPCWVFFVKHETQEDGKLEGLVERNVL